MEHETNEYIGTVTNNGYIVALTDGVVDTLLASDFRRGGGIAWSIDEKVGQTYIGQNVANTLAARDYKQPQAVIYEDVHADREEVL